MQAKVIRTFRDKHTGERHIIGSVIEVSEERFEEILTAGKFVEVVLAEKKAAEDPADPADEAAEEKPKTARKQRKAAK